MHPNVYLSKSFRYLFCNTSLQKSCLTLFPCLRQMFSTNIRLFSSKKSICNPEFVDIDIDNLLEIPSYLIPFHSFCHLVYHLSHFVCFCQNSCVQLFFWKKIFLAAGEFVAGWSAVINWGSISCDVPTNYYFHPTSFPDHIYLSQESILCFFL